MSDPEKCKKCNGTGEHRRGQKCVICKGSGRVLLSKDKEGQTVITPAVRK